MKAASSFPAILLLAVISMSRASSEANAVTASVSPSACDVSALTPAKPQEVAITYTIRNQSPRTQAWCRYCTIRLEIEEGGRAIALRNVGRDGTRKMTPSDIVTLKPGDEASLEARVSFARMSNGSLVLWRSTGDGSFWQSAPLSHPGEIHIKGAYALSFASSQSGFDSVPRKAEEFAHKLTSAPFLMAGETPLPTVKITLEQSERASWVFSSLVDDYMAWGAHGNLSKFLGENHQMVSGAELKAEIKKLTLEEIGLLNIKIALLLPLDGEYADGFRQGEYCGGRVSEVGRLLKNIKLEELKDRCRFLGVPEDRAVFLRKCIAFWTRAKK
jgi:hypothetical protein